MMQKIHSLRIHFIQTVDEMQQKYEALEQQNKQERKVLLDIIQIEQKHNLQLKKIDRSAVTFSVSGQNLYNHK